MNVTVRPPGVGRPMRGGSHELRAGAEDTAGALSFWLSETKPGKGPPLHIHEHEDELLYVVEGRYELDCGGETVELGAGGFVYLPRKVAHVFRSVRPDGPSRLMHCCVPGGMEEYFAAIGDSEPTTDEGRALRLEVGRRYGMLFPAERSARLEGAEREPPFLLARAEVATAAADTARTPMLAAERSARRLALDHLALGLGAALRLDPLEAWRVVHLVEGELELRSDSGAREPLATGTTTILPPGWSGELVHRGDAAARAMLFAAPAAGGALPA